jgi:S1-C subfamily serine protease
MGRKRTRGILTLALLAMVASGCGVGRLWEPSREEVLDRVLPSAVQIVIEQTEGRRVRTGSGVAVASRRVGTRTDCFVVTAGHTVAGLVGQSQVYVAFGGHRGAIERAPASVIAYRDAADVDLALLRTESAQCVPARTGRAAVLGEPVWVIGFPWGRHMTLTRGIVSQVVLECGEHGGREGGSRLMVDAPVSYGSSGGGVFEAGTGALIGVIEGYNTARVTPKGTSSSWYIEVPVPGQTYVTPLADVRRFIAGTSYSDLLTTGRASLVEP